MSFGRLKYKIINNMKLHVLFLNDNGFQYGAGIAQLRQMQSFLMLGHDVSAICCRQGDIEKTIPFIPKKATGIWRGMQQFPHLDGKDKVAPSIIVNAIMEATRLMKPDIVIVGNLHGCLWPLELLTALHHSGSAVIAYMHDCYYITGRCTHPFSCSSFQTGCDTQCASFAEHPALQPKAIAGAWRLRQDIFTNHKGIGLAANSQWTLGMARNALKNPFFLDAVSLGLDHRLFRKIDKLLARQILGLPEDAFIIVSGAVNVRDPHKGGHLFQEIVERFSGTALFLAFGLAHGLRGVHVTGMIRDYRKMPLLYSAADLFIGTSLAESFGQTYCEAAACSLPIVAFNVGGIPETARHGQNALLIDTIDVDQHCAAIQFFMDNPDMRQQYGSAGRDIVETEFTLEKQSERWRTHLCSFAKKL